MSLELWEREWFECLAQDLVTVRDEVAQILRRSDEAWESVDECLRLYEEVFNDGKALSHGRVSSVKRARRDIRMLWRNGEYPRGSVGEKERKELEVMRAYKKVYGGGGGDPYGVREARTW